MLTRKKEPEDVAKATAKKEASPRRSGKEHSRDPSWKKAEREAARWLQTNAGEDDDPVYRHLKTSTGRVGHLSPLQHDCTSKLYAGEVKEWTLRKDLVEAWIQINQIALARHKVPILILYPKGYTKFIHEGKEHKLSPLHCITEEHHADLLEKARRLDEIREAGIGKDD